MTIDQVTEALNEYREAEQVAADKLAALHDAIIGALRSGVRQADLVRLTGYSRERIRQIERAAGNK
jgi:hypothetical protein